MMHKFTENHKKRQIDLLSEVCELMVQCMKWIKTPLSFLCSSSVLVSSPSHAAAACSNSWTLNRERPAELGE